MPRIFTAPLNEEYTYIWNSHLFNELTKRKLYKIFERHKRTWFYVCVCVCVYVGVGGVH
jgi:hypothetical protein